MIPRLLAVVLLALLPAVASAQPTGALTFPGEARTGQDRRPARFVFSCSANGPGVTGALSLELFVASHDGLRGVFDFDAFEGPDANAGRRTRIGATEAQALASTPVAAAGWIGVEGNAGPGEGLPFGFGVTGPLRGDAPRLAAVRQAVARVLDGPGTMVWHQGNTRRGQPPIVATLTLDSAAREDLRRRLAPCLGQPPRG